jgi:hypothetical protein
LAKLLLGKYSFAVRLYGMGWLEKLLGEAVTVERYMQAGFSGWSEVMKRICEEHKMRFRTSLCANITNNSRHQEGGFPLLLMMYESCDFSEV